MQKWTPTEFVALFRAGSDIRVAGGKGVVEKGGLTSSDGLASKLSELLSCQRNQAGRFVASRAKL
jgi:hypothetical protein